ncbi:MAG: IS1380 family transposase, partial [Flavobacteriaceae bacterium]|nr:IS1380 family transposase [Flavobacteriaceae bacterium]
MNKDTNNYQSTSAKVSNSTQSMLFNLSGLGKKKVEVKFTMEKTSNDGGLLLLREVEKQIGLISGLANCIKDERHQSYVEHSTGSMLSQRVMQIAAGYEDANDNVLRDDEILKLCANQEKALATQPTISRFENKVNTKELYKMAKVFVDQFIASYESEPEIIILDPDDTSSFTYGQQELTLFNNYYGDYCYMPLHIYEGFSGKLIATVLKPGRRSKSVNVFAILRRIIMYLREQWPSTMIIVRGDSHFCSKELMGWAQDLKKVEFITGLTGNAILNKCAKVTIESAQRKYKKYNKPVKCYHSFQYRANSWTFPERVVVKVEANSMGTNVRFIVSSLKNIRPKALYEQAYCARGAAELRIKDHKTYLLSDRMSCNSFLANQFRLFLHSAAYVLIHSLQNEVLKDTEFCKSTMKTIQLKLIKLATRVKVMKTKIRIELPAEFYSKWLSKNALEFFF